MNDPYEDNDNLRSMLMETVEDEIKAGNIKVLMWLVDRMKLLETETESTERDVVDFLENLSSEDLEEYRDMGDY